MPTCTFSNAQAQIRNLEILESVYLWVKDNTIYNNVIQLNKGDRKMSKLSRDSKMDLTFSVSSVSSLTNTCIRC